MVLRLLPSLYTHPSDRGIVCLTENGQCAISLTFFPGLGDTCFERFSGGLSLTATSPSFDFNTNVYI